MKTFPKRKFRKYLIFLNNKYFMIKKKIIFYYMKNVFFLGDTKWELVFFFNNNWFFFFIKNVHFLMLPSVSCHAHCNKLVYDRHIAFFVTDRRYQIFRIIPLRVQKHIISKWKKIISSYIVINVTNLCQKVPLGEWYDMFSIKVNKV